MITDLFKATLNSDDKLLFQTNSDDEIISETHDYCLIQNDDGYYIRLLNQSLLNNFLAHNFNSTNKEIWA